VAIGVIAGTLHSNTEELCIIAGKPAVTVVQKMEGDGCPSPLGHSRLAMPCLAARRAAVRVARRQ
jgi:hypothetical protein